MYDLQLQGPAVYQVSEVNSRHLEFQLLTLFAGLEEYEMHPLEVLTHATNKEAYSSITESKSLKGYITQEPGWSMLADRSKMLKGVWFCATLYNGRIPTVSPYGNYSFNVSAKNLLDKDTVLFYDIAYYFERSPQNQYVRFVAAKKDEMDWCINNLTLVNRSWNPFLRQHDDGRFLALQNHGETVKFWLEILIVGDVSLGDKEWTETRISTGPRTKGNGSRVGLSPLLRERLNNVVFYRPGCH